VAPAGSTPCGETTGSRLSRNWSLVVPAHDDRLAEGERPHTRRCASSPLRSRAARRPWGRSDRARQDCPKAVRVPRTRQTDGCQQARLQATDSTKAGDGPLRPRGLSPWLSRCASRSAVVETPPRCRVDPLVVTRHEPRTLTTWVITAPAQARSPAGRRQGTEWRWRRGRPTSGRP
jgi:hypothetical protein